MKSFREATYIVSETLENALEPFRRIALYSQLGIISEQTVESYLTKGDWASICEGVLPSSCRFVYAGIPGSSRTSIFGLSVVNLFQLKVRVIAGDNSFVLCVDGDGDGDRDWGLRSERQFYAVEDFEGRRYVVDLPLVIQLSDSRTMWLFRRCFGFEHVGDCEVSIPVDLATMLTRALSAASGIYS